MRGFASSNARARRERTQDAAFTLSSLARRLLVSSLPVTLVAGALYITTAPGWVVGGDNGELVTLYARGGVAHPPGYPLYVLLLRAFAWLPCGAARGAAIVTAIIGALAVFALHRACRAWGASAAAAMIASAVFASSSLAWRLASSAEVFALNALIACAILAAAAPGTNARGWKRAAQLGLFAGLGIANHHSIVLLAPVGLWAFIASVREEPRRARCAYAALAALAIGLTPYAYLWFEARHADPTSAWVWGDIHDWRTLLDHVRRAEFGTTRLALRDAPLEPFLQLETFTLRLTTDLLGLPLAIVVAGLLSIRRAKAHLIALVASFVLAGPCFVAIMNIAPRGVAATIVERFYLLPEVLASVLAALALDALVRRLRDRVGVAAGIAAAAMAANIALGVERVGEDHRPTVDNYVHNTLRFAPARAIILASSDQKFAGFLYGQRVLGLRPDVTIIAPEMLRASWYRARASRDAGVSIDVPEPGRVALVEELLASGRPVAFAGPVPPAVDEAGFVLAADRHARARRASRRGRARPERARSRERRAPRKVRARVHRGRVARIVVRCDVCGIRATLAYARRNISRARRRDARKRLPKKRARVRPVVALSLLGCRVVVRRSRSRGFTLAELLTTIGFISILGALAMYGVARYLRHSKTAEAVATTSAIAQAACVYYNQSDANQPAGTKPEAAKAMRHFPPASRASVPANEADVRGKKFQSAVGDWSTSPWLDMGFKISTPQFYAYSFESNGSGTAAQATAIAQGDLDGNGIKSSFRVSATPDATFTAKPSAVQQTDPEE